MMPKASWSRRHVATSDKAGEVKVNGQCPLFTLSSVASFDVDVSPAFVAAAVVVDANPRSLMVC
jgi:hypothetical protein